MSKRFSILLVVLTIVSGLIGGLISGRIFAVSSAQAVETKQSKVLTAEGLRIVDKNGKLLMKLGKESEDNSIDICLMKYPSCFLTHKMLLSIFRHHKFH